MAIEIRRKQPPAAALPNAPQPRPMLRPPRRGVWTFFSLFLIALALVGGEVAAHYQPDLALSFQQTFAKLHGRLPEAVTPELLLQVGGGAAGVLILVLIWQAGRLRRPLFFPLALFLCLASASIGLYRGGRDIDLGRTAIRARTLESELGTLQQKLDQTTGSLHASSMAIQERDEALSALRKELEELKKKLTEKP
jgi:hypothetical protein